MYRRMLAVVLTGLALATGWPAAPAAAHAALTTAVPKAGAVLPAPPEAVVLTFNEKLQHSFTNVRMASGSTRVTLGAATTAGAVVTQPIPADLPAGTYTTSYRVVSADGHPISGDLTFRVTAVAPKPSPSVAPSSSRVPSLSATPTPTPAVGADETSNGVAWFWLAPVLGLFVALIFAMVVAGRRRGSR